METRKQHEDLRESGSLLDLTQHITKTDNQYSAAGGFSDVYKCLYHTGLGPVKVAVKAFRFKLTMGGSSDKMLRRELGIWKRLKHTNVVPFFGITYGFGISGSMSLVSLWMPNESLHMFLLKQNDALDAKLRLQLLLGVANGLKYLHSFPIVHGDLNSNNVLIDTDGTACLADFGYASLVGEVPEGLTYLQRTTTRSGTLRWCAPEQLNPDNVLGQSAETDIYSFGCVALEVLSGKQPWSEIKEDVAITLRLAMGCTPGRPESRVIDDAHWDFIQHCWSSSAEGRPVAKWIVSTMEEFVRLSSAERQPVSESIVSTVSGFLESPSTPYSGTDSLALPRLAGNILAEPGRYTLIQNVVPETMDPDVGLLERNTVRLFDGPRGQVSFLVFLNGGKHVACACKAEKTIQMFNIEDSGKEWPLVNLDVAVNVISPSKDGELIVTGDVDGGVVVWERGFQRRRFETAKQHGTMITALDVSDSHIASGSYDGAVVVWEIGEPFASDEPSTCCIEGHEHGPVPVSSLNFSPSGKHFASAYAEWGHTIKIWRTRSKELVLSIPNNLVTYSLAWSSDGRRLFSGSYGGSIRCFDTLTLGKPLWEVQAEPRPGDDSITSLCVSSNDQLLISFSAPTQMVDIWDIRGTLADKPLFTFCRCTSVFLSPNDLYLVSGDRNNVMISIRSLSGIVGPSYSLLG